MTTTAERFSTETIQQIVASAKPDQALFMVPMIRLNGTGLFSYKIASDPEIMVPCKVIQDRYKVLDNYKIEVEALDPHFGKDSFYMLDFVPMINNNRIKLIEA